MSVRRFQRRWGTVTVVCTKLLLDLNVSRKYCIFNVALNILSEQLLTMSEFGEFQTVGPVRGKARSANRLLVVGL